MFQPGAGWAVHCVLLGLALAIAAFAFKLTLVPFHLYAADVYEGAPTPVSALLATGSKAAALVALIHLLTPIRLGDLMVEWARNFSVLLWTLAALSIVVGNAVALLQRSIKRMLAYSSIAHSGYVLIGVLVYMDGSFALDEVEDIVLFYLIGYVLMNVAAFGVALTLGRHGERDIDDYAGLAQRSPVLALAMAIAMLSLTGIPATVGFAAKFFVFRAAVDAGQISIVIVAVAGSVVSAYYYLRVVVMMYMREPEGEYEAPPASIVQALALAAATVPIVGFGILPQSLIVLLGSL
jgi:NADH-quinone oxidoreductase subunit N